MRIEQAIADMADLPIPTQVLWPLLKDFKRPYDKINELVGQGVLLQLRRGLYVAGPAVLAPHPERFVIANHLYGPSYVTALAALSFRGLIPERVDSMASTTLRKSKQYSTPLGLFTYAHQASATYIIGIEQVQLSPRQTALIASPEKALCDLITQTSGLQLRSVSQCRDYLEDDLRIAQQALAVLDDTLINRCAEAGPKSSSLRMLSKTIRSYAQAMA